MQGAFRGLEYSSQGMGAVDNILWRLAAPRNALMAPVALF